MSQIADYLENKLLDAALTNTSYAATPYLALYTTTFTGDGTGATECSDLAYQRQSVTFGAASSGSSANTNTVSFSTNVDQTIRALAICDASTGGNVLFYRNINTSFTAANGLSFTSGQITVGLD